MGETDDPLLDGPIDRAAGRDRQRARPASRRDEPVQDGDGAGAGRYASGMPRALLPGLRDAAQRQHARLPGAEGDGRRGAARGVLRGAAQHRPAAAARGVLRRRRRPVDPRPPRRARGRRRPAAALAAVEPDRLRPLPRVGDGGRDDANGVFGGEADVGLLRRLRRACCATSPVPRPAAGRAAAGGLPGADFVRVVRANKIRQAVSLWKAVQTATWRQEDAQAGARRSRRRRPTRLPRGAPAAAALPLPRDPAPARADPREEASWDAFFEHTADPAGARPLRELRRRPAGEHAEHARAARDRAAAPTSSSSRG